MRQKFSIQRQRFDNTKTNRRITIGRQRAQARQGNRVFARAPRAAAHHAKISAFVTAWIGLRRVGIRPIPIGTPIFNFAPQFQICRARSKRVFPFGFARQTIIFAGFFAQPNAILRRLLPCHKTHRIISARKYLQRLALGAMCRIKGFILRIGNRKRRHATGARNRDRVRGFHVPISVIVARLKRCRSDVDHFHNIHITRADFIRLRHVRTCQRCNH